jgi:hypothetical protein
VKINPLRRRRVVGPPFQALLDNYVARAQAIADAGGGDLWVVEPSLSLDVLPDFTDAVVRHLADNGVPTNGITLLEGTASARIVVLAPASASAISEPAEIVLADAEATAPQPLPSEAQLGAR